MKSQRKSARPIGLLSLLLAATLIAVSCSSSSSDGNGAASESDSPAVQEAIESFESVQQRPEKILIDEPFDGEVPTGVTVSWLQCSIPACTVLGEALEDAAELTDWDLKIIDAGITDEEVQAAWEIAARDKPDYVIASGFSHNVYQEQMDELIDAGTVVVNIDIIDEPVEGEYIVQGKRDFENVGKLQGEAAVALADGDSDILYVTSSTFANETVRMPAFESAVETHCPTCEVTVLDIPGSDLGSPDLITKIEGEIRKNSDIGVVMLGLGDTATGLSNALVADGLADRVQLMVSDINPALLEDLKNPGTPLEVATMMEGVDMMWQTWDLLMRLESGQSVSQDIDRMAPVWHVTSENADDLEEPFPIVVDYQAQYAELWNLD